MFLNDGKVVFSLSIILFKFSRFTFCSCVSDCSGLLGCALCGCVVFPFSKVGRSFRLGCFSLLIPDVSGTVNYYYYYHHYYYYYLLIRVFHFSVSWWFLHWSLSGSKSPQVSRTLLSILAVLSNVVVWTVSTRPPTSNSSSPFSNPFVTVLDAPITIGIIVICMFHSFFNSLARSRYLSFFPHSFNFIVVSRDCKVDNFSNSLLFVDYYKVWSFDRD